jgi:hypothetical protein
VLDVRVDGPLRDGHPLRDLPVRHALRREAGDLLLAVGQAA